MKVEWTDNARRMAAEVLRYTYLNLGKHQADKLKTLFSEVAVQLGKMPRRGFLEPVLAEMDGEYRSFLIFKNLKIVYQIVDEEYAYILAVWNTRRNPEELSRHLK